MPGTPTCFLPLLPCTRTVPRYLTLTPLRCPHFNPRVSLALRHWQLALRFAEPYPLTTWRHGDEELGSLFVEVGRIESF
jgi:hypothetical protein